LLAYLELLLQLLKAVCLIHIDRRHDRAFGLRLCSKTLQKFAGVLIGGRIKNLRSRVLLQNCSIRERGSRQATNKHTVHLV